MKNALKRDYVQECLEKYKDDPKRLWREIRNFWLGKKSSNSPIGNVNGLPSNVDKAETLNNHFVNTGARIQAGLVNDDIDPSSFVYQCRPPIFELGVISISDVIESIN